MEQPQYIGPFQVISELGGDGEARVARHFLAIGTEVSSGPVIVTVPPRSLERDVAFRILMRAEGEKSKRLLGEASLPATAVAPADSELPWTATPYVPSLLLPDALAALGEPLPESTVGALGAAIARTLAANHASGIVYAGLSPSSVLLGNDGPRLLGFGFLRAAGSRPGSNSHVRPECGVPTEDARSGNPEPAGDVHALGSVLAYAAGGRPNPDLSSLPEQLRPIIRACWNPDPLQRPQGTALAVQLAALTRPNQSWLPVSVSAAIEQQETMVRSALTAADATAPPVGETQTDAASYGTTPRRRSLLIGAVAGMTGLAVGGLGAFAFADGDDTAPSARPRRVKGAAPQPSWSSPLPAGRSSLPPVIWEERVAAFPTGKGAVGIDLRTGERIWEFGELPLTGRPEALGHGMLLLPGASLKAVDAETGEVHWSERRYGRGDGLALHAPLAYSDGVLWFDARPRSHDPAKEDCTVVAYDAAAREELWRVPLKQPLGKANSVLRRELLLVQAGDGSFFALDRRSGKKKWEQRYKGIGAGDDTLTIGAPGDLLVASVEKTLAAFAARDGDPKWTFTSAEGHLGEAVHHKGTLYVTDTNKYTYALDAANGAVKWKKDNGNETGLVSVSLEFPPTALSHSGRTVLASNGTSVDAHAARNGSLLWRFTPVGDGKQRSFAGTVVGRTRGQALVRNKKSVYALPVD